MLAECKFSWNTEELKYFCEYALLHDKKYSHSETENDYNRPFVYDVECLLDNDYFEWNPEKLYVYLQLHRDF